MGYELNDIEWTLVNSIVAGKPRGTRVIADSGTAHQRQSPLLSSVGIVSRSVV